MHYVLRCTTKRARKRALLLGILYLLVAVGLTIGLVINWET